jgi:hypothetical protein
MHLMDADVPELQGTRIERIDEEPRLTVRQRNDEVSVFPDVGEENLGSRCGSGRGDDRILPQTPSFSRRPRGSGRYRQPA